MTAETNAADAREGNKLPLPYLLQQQEEVDSSEVFRRVMAVIEGRWAAGHQIPAPQMFFSEEEENYLPVEYFPWRHSLLPSRFHGSFVRWWDRRMDLLSYEGRNLLVRWKSRAKRRFPGLLIVMDFVARLKTIFSGRSLHRVYHVNRRWLYHMARTFFVFLGMIAVGLRVCLSIPKRLGFGGAAN